MRHIVDVVNFNADASCLSSGQWLKILEGGHGSLLAKWLGLYVEQGKKVSLGFPGATVADIAIHNPEAIILINNHPDVFEVILRPFAHDIALLRVGSGFAANCEYGFRTINREFRRVTPWFLPPEFMMTNEQILQLSQQDVVGIFINPARFSAETKKRIPSYPYRIRGLFDTTLACIPFQGELTNCHLHALQKFDCTEWNSVICNAARDTVFVWRDGESPFFLPDSLLREAFLLKNEAEEISREHICDLTLDFASADQLEDREYQSYPVHSFTAWMKEFRMLGFLNRIRRIEENLDRMTQEQVWYWLMAINSDILSAIEKRSPVVQMKHSPESTESSEHIIKRSNRGFEGEEYLAIMENALADAPLPDYVTSSNTPHMIKWRRRIEYMNVL